jgi:hypothetical protein
MKSFILGLVVVLGALGGIESSINTIPMIQSFGIAIVGLAIMLIGVSNLQSGN